MNTITTVLRQDVWAIRWIYPTWIATILTLATMSAKFDPRQFSNLFDYAYVFGLMTWVVLSAVLFARLALGHSPVDAPNRWRSRPLRPAMVAVAKLGLIATAFLLPVLFNAWAAQNPPPIPEIALVLLAGTFVASLVSTHRALLAALLIVGALTVFIARVLVPLPTGFSLLPHGLSPTGLLIAKLTLGIGLVGLTVRQYARPHVWGHAFAAGALLLLVGGMSWIFPDPRKPPPLLDRAALRFDVIEAHPFDDTQSPFAQYFAQRDQQWVQKFGKPRSHRNWSTQVRVDGIAPGELWWISSINPTRGLTGIGRRSLQPPIYFPTSALVNFLGLPRGTVFLEPVATTFETRFQWVRLDGGDDFPAAPESAHFQLGLHRLHHLRLLHRGPLVTGRLARELEITQLDPTGGRMDANVTQRTFTFIDSPVERHLHYTPATLVVFNPKTREAGYATHLWDDERSPSAPQRYQLPALSGDSADWQLALFVARVDAQAILVGEPSK